MWQSVTPGTKRPTQNIDDANAPEIIVNGKKSLGKRCVIVGHPSADKSLLRHCDVIADENQLAEVLRLVSDARYLVMCGPRAMAETADMLTSRDRVVFQPQAPEAHVDPIPAERVMRVWSQMANANLAAHATPVGDMSLSPSVKAFIGNHMGVVCTIDDTRAGLEWALRRSRNTLYIGDRRIALSMLDSLGLNAEKDVAMWNPDAPLGGHVAQALKTRKLWIWDVEYGDASRDGAMNHQRLAAILDELASGRTPREMVSVPRATASAAVKGIRRLGSVKPTP